jgi:CRISPR-associated protein Cas1
MLKQTLFFSTPVRLSLKNLQLVISWKDSNDIVTRPIEDIGFMIIENQMIYLTIPLMNELVKNNVCVIFCDAKGMPSSILQGLYTNSTQGEILKSQVSVSEPAKKQAWRQIIEHKIKNQSLVLEKIHGLGDKLKPYYHGVKSGDTSNMEGIAARQYWQLLLGKDFKREREGLPPNNLLNYGYAILRAATARAILGSGLLPGLGLFHRNRYNAFPLADDLMEAYRPFVDDVVYEAAEEGIFELNKEAKQRLLKILTMDVKIGKVIRPLEIALTSTTASLVKYYKGEIKNLNLPIFE